LRQEEVILKVPSSPAYVSVVRHAVASLARKMSFSAHDVGDIQLAVGEACNNAVKHGLEDGCDPVRIRCKIGPDDLCIEVTNRYSGAPPCGSIGCKPEPCAYNEGGMGVFLMNTLVDSVEFRWGKRTATVSLTKVFRGS
jgi:serine/threonine-protein kinase RsbW